jgi:hypothetical protein
LKSGQASLDWCDFCPFWQVILNFHRLKQTFLEQLRWLSWDCSLQSSSPSWYQVSKPIQFSSGSFTFVLHQIKKLRRFKPRRFHQKDLIFCVRFCIECSVQKNFPWSIKWSKVPLNFVATWLNHIVFEMSIQLKRDAGEEGSDMRELFWNWQWSLKCLTGNQRLDFVDLIWRKKLLKLKFKLINCLQVKIAVRNAKPLIEINNSTA